MHQIFSEGRIVEKHVFIESILLLVMLTYVFLRHYLQKEADEFDSHVWVVYPTVHDYTDTTCELQVHVLICSDVYFWIEHLEEFWEGVKIKHYQLG